MKQINVGIIGCGSITRFRHAPEYRANPYVNDIFFYDNNTSRATALAQQFNGRVVDKVEELFNNPNIVAISDCSSNESHHINSTKALLHGKHVLCEKPMATSVEKARVILEAQKKSGKKLMIDHNQRLTKVHQRAKSIIENKELGKALTFKTTFGHQGPEKWSVDGTNATWFFKKERSHSGVAGDLGIHKIDLIHYLLDDEIDIVHSFTGALDKVDESGTPIEVCDNVVCAMKTKRGRLGTASFSWTYYGSEDNSTTIYFEKGMMKIYHHDQYPLIIEMKDGSVVKHELEPMQTNDNQTNSGVIDAFVDCIINDKVPLITGEDALASLIVIEKILNDK
ncbi:Gfo/Idh/MocA family protein [Evansella cellulosilytica]|uniref:Oxidoreductase domain protein n=1 Tax=Evansella cellulosilytica (strain ATCC 21833 / DSM 2522 / FERM P-1141 / JCM 9156 / N-4) TaxID=649639 RepID=E6TW73_EVAC2|nr:Gfo/Idh/MocA family oxidoreductase [Evansella cellulosilytica]ADU31029.1 oxidoreductase domain protein [Evansella cellulosilytica DSM 2522]